MTDKVAATWSVSLTCECPHCEQWVDLLEYNEFWEDHDELKTCETGTFGSRNLEVICPECRGKFIAECYY